MTDEKAYVEPPEEHPDEWHEHTPDEGEPQHEHGARVNAVTVGAILFVTSALVVGLIIAVTIYFNSYMTQMKQERIEVTTGADQHQAKRAGAESELSRFGWIDPQDGVVRVPVDVAAEQVIEAYRDRGDNSDD